MIKFLSKYGVVSLIALVFLGIISFVMYDQAKNTVPGKAVDGESVAFSIAKEDVTAGEYYDEMYKLRGIAAVASLFEKAVTKQAIEITAEMKENAALFANNTLSSYITQSGEVEGRAQLNSDLKGYGYTADTLEDFYLDSIRISKLSEQYIDANKEEYVPTYFEEAKPRLLSHILISIVDPENPTEEELAKMQAVDDALKNGTTFEEAAVTYSDDSGSAVSNGYLGFSDKDTQYVPEFLAASLELNEGETSEWIKTQFGYHLIRCDASSFETINAKEPGAIYDGILNKTPTIRSLAIWKKAEELGVTFANEELKQELLTYLGISELVGGTK